MLKVETVFNGKAAMFFSHKLIVGPDKCTGGWVEDPQESQSEDTSFSLEGNAARPAIRQPCTTTLVPERRDPVA